MHSSSSLTLFLKYFIPIFVLTPILISLLESDASTEELVLLCILVGLLTFLYVRSFGKLRKVKALHNHLVTDTINYEETINYDKIIYVYQIAFFSPIMIGLKYIDDETGEHKKFYTLASWSNQIFSFNFYGISEVDLTQFIRRKALSNNLQYDESKEPSRWTPIIYLVLTILLIALMGNFLIT